MVTNGMPRPEVITLQSTDTYAKFTVEPLERGFATSLGNPLRRMLLSGVPGAAVTWIRIEGLLHEYTAIPHVREDVQEFILNGKSLRIRALSDRPGTLQLDAEGQTEVFARDIIVPPDFEIVNPDLRLATLDSPDAKLSVQFNVEHGKGYQPAEAVDGMPIGIVPVDAIFSPVRKVNYTVEHTRVGQFTDYERLVVEVLTDGTIGPLEAMRTAAGVIGDHFALLVNVAAAEGEEGSVVASSVPAEQYNMPVEKLNLTSRTVNSLKRAGLNKVGEILEMPKQALLKTRNFGAKSMQEVYKELEELGLVAPEGEAEVSAEIELEVEDSGTVATVTEDGQDEPSAEEKSE